MDEHGHDITIKIRDIAAYNHLLHRSGRRGKTLIMRASAITTYSGEVIKDCSQDFSASWPLVSPGRSGFMTLRQAIAWENVLNA